MAKFTFTTDHNLFTLSHHNTPSQTSILNSSSLKHRHHLNLLLPSRPRLKKFAVSCSIKEKENEKFTGPVLTGLRLEEDDSDGRLGDDESSSGEVGFGWNWKNLPQRYKVIGTTSLAFVICNMDKVNLSIAIIPMSHQFGWNSSTAGLVQSSFFWGYALSQLPGGFLAKIFGGRKVLEFGVLMWSLATALVPFVAGYMPGLVLTRILVGIGEGVSPSAATDLIARLVPLQERSRSVAFVFGGLSVGSVAGLLLAPPLIQSLGWESVFYLFGLLGIAWFLGFQVLKEEQPSSGTSKSSWSQSIYGRKSQGPSIQELGGSIKDVNVNGCACRGDVVCL